MALTPILDHSAQAVARLVQQFRGQTTLETFVGGAAGFIQELEGVFFELIDERTLDASVGVQLDGLGSVVGVAREGRTDPEYRLRIRAQVRLNLSSGTPEELLTIVLLIIAAPHALTLTERFLAGFDLQDNTPLPTATATVVSQIIQQAKAAGVYAIFIWQEFDDSLMFTMDDASAPFFPGVGFDDGTQTVGGYLAGALAV